MTSTRARKSKRLLGFLLLLTVGFSLCCACQSSRQLCPAYDSHYKRETLPY